MNKDYNQHIKDVCKDLIKNVQQLYQFCQLNFKPNETINVFQQMQNISDDIKKLYKKVSE